MARNLLQVGRNYFYAEWNTQDWNDDFADVMALNELYIEILLKRRARAQRESSMVEAFQYAASQ